MLKYEKEKPAGNTVHNYLRQFAALLSLLVLAYLRKSS